VSQYLLSNYQPAGGALEPNELQRVIVQDAFTAAAETWPARGVPPNPQAWIVTTARRRAIDRLRREDTARKHSRSAMLATLEPAADPMEDDELRLLFLCCHPSLSTESQVVLTLRFAGGLTAAEIAPAGVAPAARRARRLWRYRTHGRAAAESRKDQSPGRLDQCAPA